MYDSSTISFIFCRNSWLEEVVEVAAAIGSVITGLIIRTVLGALVVGALVIFLWKLSKLADAYTGKLKAK